ncbi:uncharacterized protein LOC141718518 [Apium graveolens]|uniref:uncharacterized protein LOC141718518 n=1 Tax=Apium graveolens TaxID=4045 RepID=UPI003D792E3B
MTADLDIRLKVSSSESGRENNVGPSDEVDGIMVHDMNETDGSCDIIMDSHVRGLERISDIHPKLMALQYPCYFLMVVTNFIKQIQFGKVDSVSEKKGNFDVVRLLIGDDLSCSYDTASGWPCLPQNFQDALVVCRFIGHPDIFHTMTKSPLCDEVVQMMKLLPQCSPQNLPDMMNLQENVDNFISAEIPDPEVDPFSYPTVTKFMLHGPYGKEWPRSPCMKQFKCMRYCESTTFDQSGFPIYRRRKTNITVRRGKVDLDNQWVVPYNRDLLVKYQCHINVKIYAHARSLKYLFKYFLKGHERATVEIRGQKRKLSIGEGMDEYKDEIQSYFDGRYICGCEAVYRLFRFNIHYRCLVVEQISFHLQGRKPCTFRANEPLAKVLNQCFEIGFPDQIRQLFVHILLNCKVTDLNALWNGHWVDMVDDLMKKQREITEVHNILKSIVRSLEDYTQLPQPPHSYLDCLEIYNGVMQSVNKGEGGMFFVYGGGGCGKTFLWRTIIAKLMSRCNIILPVASSGIAETLMPRGRTAHSRFKIPIILDEHSMCSISHVLNIDELIKRTNLIIWDKAPMQHRYSFECVDQSLRDILKAVDP